MLDTSLQSCLKLWEVHTASRISSHLVTVRMSGWNRGGSFKLKTYSRMSILKIYIYILYLEEKWETYEQSHNEELYKRR